MSPSVAMWCAMFSQKSFLRTSQNTSDGTACTHPHPKLRRLFLQPPPRRDAILENIVPLSLSPKNSSDLHYIRRHTSPFPFFEDPLCATIAGGCSLPTTGLKMHQDSAERCRRGVCHARRLVSRGLTPSCCDGSCQALGSEEVRWRVPACR